MKRYRRISQWLILRIEYKRKGSAASDSKALYDKKMSGFIILAGIIALPILVAVIAAIATVVTTTAFVQKNPDDEE